MLAASPTLSSAAAAAVQVQRHNLLGRTPSLPQIRISRPPIPPRPISASCASPAAERHREKAGAYHHFHSRAAEAAGPLAASATLYDVLGLPAGATAQEIKAAFRRLARERHPDVAAADRKSASAEEFIRIHSAYATLSDPDKRAEYDCRMAASAPRRRPSFSSYSYPSAASSNSAASSGFARRTWETDQCW